MLLIIYYYYLLYYCLFCTITVGFTANLNGEVRAYKETDQGIISKLQMILFRI